MKVWLVKHPISRYNEDVKSLARRAGLRIVDAKFKKLVADEFIENEPPKLTLKGETATADKLTTALLTLFGTNGMTEKPGVDACAVMVDGKSVKPTAAQRDAAWSIFVGN